VALAAVCLNTTSAASVPMDALTLRGTLVMVHEGGAMHYFMDLGGRLSRELVFTAGTTPTLRPGVPLEVEGVAHDHTIVVSAMSRLAGPLIAAAEKKGCEPMASGELKTAPRGYAKDHPRVELLRGKGLTAGYLPMKDEEGKLKANIFFVAYTKEGSGARRPITFTFNGGPGSSSVWLHLGAVGPKRVLMTDEGKPLPDLILIDGGKGQLEAAYEALESLGLAGDGRCVDAEPDGQVGLVLHEPGAASWHRSRSLSVLAR